MFRKMVQKRPAINTKLENVQNDLKMDKRPKNGQKQSKMA